MTTEHRKVRGTGGERGGGGGEQHHSHQTAQASTKKKQIQQGAQSQNYFLQAKQSWIRHINALYSLKFIFLILFW